MTASLVLLLALQTPPAVRTADDPPAARPADAVPSFKGRTLTEWLADLNGTDEEKQRAALVAIMNLGPKAKAVVPDLRKLLLNKESNRRWDAAYALAAIGPDAKDALPDLYAVFREQPAGNYGAVPVLVDAIGSLGGASAETTRALILIDRIKGGGMVLPSSAYAHAAGPAVVGHVVDLCADKDASVRARAATCLGLWSVRGCRQPGFLTTVGDVAKRVPGALETLLTDGDITVRIAGAHALVQVSPESAAKALPIAVEALKTKEDGATTAAFILAPAAAEAFPALLPLLDDPATHDRTVSVISQLAVIPQTQKELKENPSARIRAGMAKSLGRRYTTAAAAIPALVAALKDADADVRFAAAEALVWVVVYNNPPAAAPALPVLCEALKPGNPERQQHAAELIARIGPAAKAAVPALKDALADRLRGVRARAALALVEVDRTEGPTAVPFLIEALAPGTGTARTAARVLATLGPAAAQAVPELVKLYTSDDRLLRLSAAEAAARIDPAQGPKAAEVILGLMTDKKAARQFRFQGPQALRRIGPPAKAAVAALCSLLGEKGFEPEELATAAVALDPEAATPAVEWIRKEIASDPENADRVAELLAEAGPNAKVLAPELTGLLKVKSQFVRQSAAKALGAIGPGAAVSVPALRAIERNDPDPEARKTAAAALAAIEAKK
jgi:HEAT repeat protein